MLTAEARRALRLRLDGAKASIKKLPKILEQLSPDDRLRNQYAFYKAHTGRWAGKGAQLQNLKAPRTKEEKEMVSEVIRLLQEGREVPSLAALSLALRPLICAPKGKKITLGDFKSVENRLLMWAAGCDTGLQVYREGRDPYVDFAARCEGVDFSEVTAEMRQQFKSAVLGAGFGLGGGQLVRKCKCSCKHIWNVKAEVTEPQTCPMCGKSATPGLIVKTGLWRYAEMMGIDLTQDEAARQVEAFRETFMEVANFWYYLEEAFAACCRTRRDQHINSSLGCKLRFTYKDPALRIVLPSGRELVYPNAFAREERTPFGGKKLTIGFEASRGSSWGVHHTYGGRLCENIVQGLGVDLLCDSMARVEADRRFELFMHTHDELVTLTDEKDTGAKEQLEHYMSIVEPWAVGLPMAADGYEGKRYAKG